MQYLQSLYGATGAPLIALTWVLLTAAGCSRHPPATEPARPVIALPVAAVEMGLAAQFPGELHSRYEMPLSFRVAGQLSERSAHLGDRVKQGQALARLDPTDAAKAVASAKAALDAAEQALSFATKQRDRDEAQSVQNLISQLQLDQTHNSYAAALATRDQARAQLALAQNQLRYNTLVAEHDGSITSEQAEVGQVVAAGQAVFGFAWSGERDVYVAVPEAQLSQVAVGQHATVLLPSMPDKPFTGHVRELAPAADAQSRTYHVKIALDADARELPLGMTAQVALTPVAGAVSAVRVPATALFHDKERPAVWVVRTADSTLELRGVTVSRYGEHDVWISAGLSGGERVLMQGVHTVSAGEKVEPVAPPHPEDSPL
jgi:RND family efflux transporter MFP subunit